MSGEKNYRCGLHCSNCISSLDASSLLAIGRKRRHTEVHRRHRTVWRMLYRSLQLLKW